jgi:hypothetical protein
VVEDSLKRNPYIFGFPYKQVVESDEVWGPRESNKSPTPCSDSPQSSTNVFYSCLLSKFRIGANGENLQTWL